MKLTLLLCLLMFPNELRHPDRFETWENSTFESWEEEEDYSIQYVFHPEEDMCMEIPPDTFVWEDVYAIPVEEFLYAYDGATFDAYRTEPVEEDSFVQYQFTGSIDEEGIPIYEAITCICLRCICDRHGCWLGCGNAAQVGLIFYSGLFDLPELYYHIGGPFEPDYGKIWNNKAEYLWEIRP